MTLNKELVKNRSVIMHEISSVSSEEILFAYAKRLKTFVSSDSNFCLCVWYRQPNNYSRGRPPQNKIAVKRREKKPLNFNVCRNWNAVSWEVLYLEQLHFFAICKEWHSEVNGIKEEKVMPDVLTKIVEFP